MGLYPSERKRLARLPGVEPVFLRETNEHAARRRLRVFGDIVKTLPPATPVAYWDAGDVIFQSRLHPLWEMLRAHPGKLLAVCEPDAEHFVEDQWTKTITDPAARRNAQRTMFQRPFINAGFLVGPASALTSYFETVAHWYQTSKLGGSADPGDQLALNLYCHSRPEVWHRIPESWNYCLWGRRPQAFYRCTNGQYIDRRGVPIYVVHGNAQTLKAPQFLYRPF